MSEGKATTVSNCGASGVICLGERRGRSAKGPLTRGDMVKSGREEWGSMLGLLGLCIWMLNK